jgi:hypothetical protein
MSACYQVHTGKDSNGPFVTMYLGLQFDIRHMKFEICTYKKFDMYKV